MKDSKNNIPTYVYNEKYDEEHYPVKDFMYDRLVEVNQYLELGDGKEWFYFATIHGVIFETYDVFGRNRLGKNELEFFSKLGNLRWVESDGKTFSFALTHYEKEEV